jgi:oligoribonuclease
MAQDASNLIWIDMEMSGLDPDRDRVLEIAIVVTNANLDVVAEAAPMVIHQPDAVLTAMDAWNTSTHARTGLTERVRASRTTEGEAEQRMLDFVAAHVPPATSPMCGNSVHQDRRFLARYMPRLEAHFLYRNLDVSTLKELAKRWRPSLLEGLVKAGRHEALADIHESIDELKYYREHFLRL